MSTRRLIVNADDFGLTEGVTRGILDAHRHGIVTSTSLMVRGAAAASAVRALAAAPTLGVGLHVDLGEWIFRDGEWVQIDSVVPIEDARRVAEEVDRQLRAFVELTDSEPTHLDSHQHVHRREPAGAVLRERAAALGVPLRHASAVRYCGAFYGQTNEGAPAPANVTADALIAVLRALEPGATELACHPGYAAGLDGTMYLAEREAEVAALCDPRVRSAIEELGIELLSFATLRQHAAGRQP